MKSAPAEAATKARWQGARPWLDFGFAFVCVFGGLSLPFAGLGRVYAGVHAALGNALLSSSLESGVQLVFRSASEVNPAEASAGAWSLTLLVTPLAPAGPLQMPMDLRTLVYLPTACFVALALATPLAPLRRKLAALGSGLAILQPLLWLLVALPVVSFLGGTGPVRAYSLGLATHTVLQILYRALVASPGMAYVIPLLLWWALCGRLAIPKTEHSDRNPKSTATAT